MSRYLLVPVDDLENGGKEITIPEGLGVNPFEELYVRVSDVDKLKNLLLRLTKAGIYPNDDGFVKHKDIDLNGVLFEDAVVDSCNGNYLHCYESFYELLRKFGIVF